MDSDWKAGLEDVIAARSGICTIDGTKGQLYYRGYEIGELAGHVSFEDVTMSHTVSRSWNGWTQRAWHRSSNISWVFVPPFDS